MANTKRRCIHCKTLNPVINGIVCNFGFLCSTDCQNRYGMKDIPTLQNYIANEKEKAIKVRHKMRLAKLKTKSAWLKEAQAEFNKFIRLRDINNPCISCGRSHDGQYHAGHFLSVGACAELRFNEDNCHKQCAPCNNHLSGNAIRYRARLINKIGLHRVEFLEGPHKPQKHTIKDVQAIRLLYKDKWKELENKLAQ